MIHEYLFLTNDHRENVESYKPDGINVNISSIDPTALWLARYYLNNINEDTAKRLSDVHSFIMQYSPLVLSCGSSEYYNKVLFPLVNELERKLRKLLYLAASISDNEKAKESIRQLEAKDFGEIFDLLFIDQIFISDMKKRINADNKSEFNGMSKYSKAEILDYVNALSEQTLWDTILADKDVPTLRSRFRDVQTFRNNVMHAHNISKEIFGKSRYLFNKINKELDTAIGHIIHTESEPAETKPDVNTAISSAMAAMAAMDLSTISNEALGKISQWSHNLQDLRSLNVSSSIADSIRNIQTEAIKALNPLANDSVLAEAIKHLNSPASNPVLAEAIKHLNLPAGNPILAEAIKHLNPLENYPVLAKAIEELQALRKSGAFAGTLRDATSEPTTMNTLGQVIQTSEVNEENKLEPDNEKHEEADPGE